MIDHSTDRFIAMIFVCSKVARGPQKCLGKLKKKLLYAMTSIFSYFAVDAVDDHF